MQTLSSHTQQVARTRWLVITAVAIVAQAALALLLRYDDAIEQQRTPQELSPSVEQVQPLVRGSWTIA